MKASIFESKKTPAISDAELDAQKAAFFASGGKIRPVGIKPAEPEIPRFNGKNHEDIGKTYQQTL